MSSIVFAAVSKRYDGIDAVKHLDLSCESGEMLALLLPSGCGKSTTLKMAAGIESITGGEIYFGQRWCSLTYGILHLRRIVTKRPWMRSSTLSTSTSGHRDLRR